MQGIGNILNLLQKVKKLPDGSYQVQCPSHPDKNPSLNLKQDGQKILLNCFAGCTTESIVEKLGLTMADLFIDDKVKVQASTAKQAKIVAEYSYCDESGQELFQVVRYEPKNFAQRHKNGDGNWDYNLTGVRRVIYHLPEIQQYEGTCWLVEGEKDADKLWEYGLVATTSPGGANNWKPEYADYLIDKKVVVIPDKDEPGYNYAKDAVRSLQTKAREIKCIVLPEPAKDISDWLEAGGDIAMLPGLEQDIAVLFDSEKPKYQQDEEAISWYKNIEGRAISFRAESLRQERTGIHGRISISCDYQSLGWTLCNIERAEERIRLANTAHSQFKGEIAERYSKDSLRRDLDTFCAGLWDYQISTFVPEMLRGDNTPKPLKFLLYPYVLQGGGTILFSPPGRGKSFSALLWAVSVNAGLDTFWSVSKAPVLFINLERSKQSLKRRLAHINKTLGLPWDTPLLTLNARGKSLSEVMPACRKAVKQYNIELVVLDSISRAGFGDLNENRPVNAIIDALSGLCDTWLALGHSPRATEEHIYGGIHFDAGADLVVQLSSQISDDGTLGVGFIITKQNDIGYTSQQIWAFEFNEFGLCGVRKAKPFEFPEIESKRKANIIDTILDFIQNQDGAEATATEINEALGYDQGNISKILNHSGRFTKTRKEGRSQYYGVKSFLK